MSSAEGPAADGPTANGPSVDGSHVDGPSAERSGALGWPPPTLKRNGPSRVAYVLAAILPLVQLLVLAVPLGVAWGVARWRSGGATSTSSAPAGPTSEGQPGVGDSYFPSYGSSGYDALKYTLVIDWDAPSESLRATTTISARASQRLVAFYVDLALTTDRVSVDGQPATFQKYGLQDVKITPTQPIAAGAPFIVTIDYSGAPGKIRRDQPGPWFRTGQEWTVAGEPESSAWWFPADDYPADPALMDISVRVPAGMEAVSIGRLESADTGNETDFDTWHWISDRPVASYLAFLSIGQYELKQGVAAGLPYVYAVSQQLSPGDRRQAFAALFRSSEIVTTLESMFGPYPFGQLGGVVPAHKLWFSGLETQTRPVYDRKSILEPDFAEGLVVHELAHMWFGDNVTLRQWNDIFTNEAYASWAQWGYRERTVGGSANDALNATFDRLKDKSAFWRVTMIDPGREQLFDTVYQRGPMTLQALRNVIGDQAFFSLARDWSQHPGARSLEEWMVKAQSKTSVDLLPFFQAWLYDPRVPERTPANGFRS